MRKRITIISASALFMLLAAGVTSSFGSFASLHESWSDFVAVKNGYEDFKNLRAKYSQLEDEAKQIYQDFHRGNIVAKFSASLRTIKIIHSREGKQALRDCFAFYDKYNPVFRRIMARFGPEDKDGNFSQEQIKKAANSYGLFGIGNYIKEHPFTFMFHPGEIKEAYQKNYETARQVLEAYNKVSNFIDKSVFGAYLRFIAGAGKGKIPGDEDIFRDYRIEEVDSASESSTAFEDNQRIFYKPKLPAETIKKIDPAAEDEM